MNEVLTDDKHIYFMQLAIEQALLAKDINEIPVGAILVDIDGNIIGKGYNQTITNNDPTAHAEIVALRDAAQFKSNYRLPDTSLYVTLEPCMMCLGSILHARVKNVYFGASDKKTGVCGGQLSLHENTKINHHTVITPNILQNQCSSLLIEFFKTKRKKL